MKNIKQAEFGRREIEIAEQGTKGSVGLLGLGTGSGDQELRSGNSHSCCSLGYPVFLPKSVREGGDVAANVDAVSHPFSSRSRALAGFNVLLALDRQGFCNTFRDMKAENPATSPGSHEKLSYRFQWGDWVTPFLLEGEDNPGAFGAALLRRGSSVFNSGASPAATGLVTVLRCLPPGQVLVPDSSLPLSLSLGQVTNDTGVLVLFCTDLPGQR